MYKRQENNLIAGTTIGAGVILPLFSATAGAQWVSTFNDFGRMYMTNNIFIAVTVGIVMNLLITYLLARPEDKVPNGNEK